MMRLSLPKTRTGRRLALFAIANSVFLALLPAENRPFDQWWIVVASFAAAQAVLLSLWVAWGPPPAWKRWGTAMALVGLAVYIELMGEYFGVRGLGGSAIFSALVVAMVSPFLLAVLVPVRDCLGCELWVDEPPRLRRPQLHLRSLFVWILLAAVPLGLLRVLDGPKDQPLFWMSVAACAIPLLMLDAAISVASVYIGRRWYLGILVGASSIFLLAWGEETAICYAVRYFRDPQGAWFGYQDMRYQIRLAHLAFVTTLLVNLVILKLIGVRIVFFRPRLDAHSTTPAPQPSNSMPQVSASS